MAGEAERRRGGLWRRRDFLLLWGGQSVSALGSQVTVWALPLTAVLLLHATPAQMGLLAACGAAPVALLGLPAGAWVDRLPRRPVMIVTDLGRALFLGSVPLAAVLGRLSLAQLYAVAFLAGALGVCFDAAYQSLLPALVPRDRLVEGNGKLEASAALAGVAGPGLAGVLTQVATAPAAIVIDALSFVASALSLALIGAHETPPEGGTRRHLAREIGEGLRTVAGHPVLRALVVGAALFNLFDSVLVAVYVLYLTRTLGLTAALIGVVFVLGGAGGLLGALAAERVLRRLGLGRALLGGALLAGLAELLIAMACGPQPVAAALVIAGEACVQGGAVLYAVNSVSLRQSLVPDRLQGRVSATARLVAEGATPLGALAGGVCATQVGLRPTVIIAGAGTLLAFLWLLASPLRRLRTYPPEEETQA